jgi:hypothetical protein
MTHQKDLQTETQETRKRGPPTATAIATPGVIIGKAQAETSGDIVHDPENEMTEDEIGADLKRERDFEMD